MLLSLVICTYTLGIRAGKDMRTIMNEFTEAIKDVILIILIIGGAGSLKEIMMVSGVSQTIVDSLSQINIHPYLLAWLMAALIRICVGSATAAGLMTAGVLLPLLQLDALDANLLVLAIGAGSLMCSHVNDPGFWLFKEYFGTSMKDTVKSWTVMESLVSVLGIVLFLYLILLYIKNMMNLLPQEKFETLGLSLPPAPAPLVYTNLFSRWKVSLFVRTWPVQNDKSLIIGRIGKIWT